MIKADCDKLVLTARASKPSTCVMELAKLVVIKGDISQCPGFEWDTGPQTEPVAALPPTAAEQQGVYLEMC